MAIYVCVFIMCMLVGNSILGKTGTDSTSSKNKIGYLVFITLVLGLLAGFRSWSVGYDTYGYRLIFEDVWIGSVDQIISSISRIEPGFVLWCAVIKILGGDVQWLYLTTSLFVVGSFCVFTYRHSKSVLFSVFILFSFQYYYSSFDIIRHFMATSFLLLGYKYVEERKLQPFLIYIIVGSFFHKVAFIYAIIYLLPLIKWSRSTIIIGGIITFILNAFISRFAVALGLLLGKGDYTEKHESLQWVGAYSGGEKTFFLFLVIFILMYIIFRYNKIHKLVEDKKNNEYLSLVFLLVVCSFLFINARMMTRFVMTSSGLIAIAIPNLLITDGQTYCTHTLQKRVKNIIIVLGLIYHVFLLWSNWQNVVPYVPFWEE